MKIKLLYFFIFIFFQLKYIQAQLYNTWEECLESKEATIRVFWHTSKPFIYKDDYGNLEGIEYELMNDFQSYIKNAYNINLTIDWIETQAFQDIVRSLSDSKDAGSFGVSALSITNARQQQISFSPPYMPDISVLISHKNTKTIKNVEEFKSVFDKMTAITIAGTSYEKDLIDIKHLSRLDFKIEYIPSNQNILRSIAGQENTFGFIDLPVYLLHFSNNPGLNIKRQNLFPIKRIGYAIAFTKNSDWQSIMEEYFLYARLKNRTIDILSQYLDYDIFTFIEDIYNEAQDEVVLLTKEKEIQGKELQRQTSQIERESVLRNFLIISVIIIFFLFFASYRLYQKRYKDMRMVAIQKEKIELQSKFLEKQQVDLKHSNQELTELNNEKNKLIKILAHDMRTPINQISGLAHLYLLENKKTTAENKHIINEIINSGNRLNQMISKILDVDAIDKKEVNFIKSKIMISEVCQQIQSEFEKQAYKKGITLNLDVRDHNLSIMADPMYFRQIIENLVSNAIKFSSAKSNVWMKAEKIGNRCLVSIVDQGPGLTKEDKQSIFKNFQRLSAKPTGGEQSTGLGLSIVKKYTELMGGSIDYESMQGKGSTFIVAFDCL